MVEEKLYVLCRGRVRGAGGVSASIDDQAGTIYAVDPHLTEPASLATPGAAVRQNGTVLARPASPPFRLWDRAAMPPQADHETDRPYCALRFHEPTRSFYLCGFSGIDLSATPGDPIDFSKNSTDALLRYDLRLAGWREVERHHPGPYPSRATPPQGWLAGPDNCLPLGSWLYAVAKDNSRLVRYDLRPLERDPEAGPPRGIPIGPLPGVTGHSALAFHEGWLYVAGRTSSRIVRLALDENFVPREPLRIETVAQFEPFDPVTRRSADITDMTFDDRGRLYVVCAQPARVHRFTPDPARPYTDAREPWLDLAARLGKPRLKSENILCAGGWLYITSGDSYAHQAGADGAVYRAAVED